MDETRSERPRKQPGEPRRAPGDRASGGAAASGRSTSSRSKKKSSAEIEREIGHTRAEMNETVDELQRRLSPGHLKRQARGAVRQSVRGTAQGAGHRMMGTVKENPIPSIIAGLSVGWLVAKGSSSSGRHGRAPGGEGWNLPPGVRDPSHHHREASHHEASSGSVHRMQGQASGAADRARGKASQYGHQAQHQAQQLQHQAQRAAGRAERMMKENPVAAGAAALAVGAFVGLIVPETRKEDELMGPARDRAVHEAQAKASDALHRAERVAERTAEEAKASAQHVKETAKEEAKKQKKQSKKRS